MCEYMYVSNVRVQIGDIIPCLHTSIMAKDLTAERELPLSFSPGTIIALKSAKFDLTVPRNNDWASVSPRMDLNLYNIDNDIILRITILRGTNKVFFNDRANKSLLDGWRQEKSVELRQEDVDRWQRSGVTISVYNRSNPSKEQYQILFDLTTIYHFDKYFPGPAIKINYSAQRSPDDTNDSGIPTYGILSNPLKVSTYKIDDLPFMEQQALNSERWVDSWWCFFITHRKLVLPRRQPLLHLHQISLRRKQNSNQMNHTRSLVGIMGV